MDFLPDSLLSLIQQHPTFQTLTSTPIASHLASLHTTYLTPYISHCRSAYLDPYLIHPLASLLTSSMPMPDLVSIFILALVLIISLKILDYARRLVMFWVNLALRLLWWALVLGALWYVYSVGIEKTGRDLGWLVGVAGGLWMGLGMGWRAGGLLRGLGVLGGMRRGWVGGGISFGL
ncbi:hypothetical protein BO83DRAFT_457927 [Aspergillus eucalypticola CBS 122712]|uniref:Nuclear pore assembly and biogenesis-domain-containing protein n=1 Tax=Aspergillus eucalypticola (strain CBS 122712 / IBT 29274) TaxID=1448314 RepID=A0A317W620_ASPEC|nr:uncharacterized protein BO83DRAFT_457927 [Aspergillus eucalypticola CBS 122712]PWY81485.1 hypothetical protein BO83DRAFT_457927 [Aspergillus eucalypticola CBS 122712]